jgi:hypothetical protein
LPVKSHRKQNNINGNGFSQVSETQGAQNDKTDAVTIAIVFTVLRSLRCRCLYCCLRKGRSHRAPAARLALFIHRAAAATCEKPLPLLLFVVVYFLCLFEFDILCKQ